MPTRPIIVQWNGKAFDLIQQQLTAAQPDETFAALSLLE